MDDTFTTLDRENVDDFLQHLKNQQPSIHFTMESEKDNELAFLDTAVLRELDGRITTSVYRKPTHTDHHLAYDSHHPQSVKRGIVKCLYERAKRLVTKPSVISEEKKHLSSVLVSNGYPFSFLQKLTKTGKPNNSAEPANEFKATAVLPVSGRFDTKSFQYTTMNNHNLFYQINSMLNGIKRLVTFYALKSCAPEKIKFKWRSL